MTKDFWHNNFKGDRTIWIIFFALIIISAIEVYSASSSLAYGPKSNGNFNGPIFRHLILSCVGIGFAFGFHLVNINRWARIISIAGWPICIAWVLYVSFTGNAVNGAARWATIPHTGIQLQPSELLKLAYIVFIAYIFSCFPSYEESKKKIFAWLIPICLLTVVAIGKDNTSNAILIFTTSCLVFCLAYAKSKWLITGVLSLTIAGTIGIAFVKTDIFQDVKNSSRGFGRLGTGFERVERFVNAKEPGDKDFKITDKNFQPIHGKIAIANSHGLGVLPGRSKERDVLPQAYSDFIYAIIIEETGIFGGALVLFLYLLLLFRVGRIIALSKSRFAAITAAGLGLMLVLQALINVCVAVGLIPVTGQPLPLISRGGTSAIVISIYFGILLSISRYECEEQENNKKGNATTETVAETA